MLTPRRLLGTPTEQDWPGVTSFPDFKQSFPKWHRETSKTDGGVLPLCSNLDSQGLDLLELLLIYDPAGRISAKGACSHPYFEDGAAAYSGRGLGPTYTTQH